MEEKKKYLSPSDLMKKNSSESASAMSFGSNQDRSQSSLVDLCEDWLDKIPPNINLARLHGEASKVKDVTETSKSLLSLQSLKTQK